MVTPARAVAALLTLIPFLTATFFSRHVARWAEKMLPWARYCCPSVLCTPYALVAGVGGTFTWGWFTMYAILPIAFASLLGQAARADPNQHGN
jgi:uncharacterized protein